MTVREIIDHFAGDQEVTIIENNVDCMNIIYVGYTRWCLSEIPIVYIDKVCHDWKVINGMLNIWV